MKWKEYRPNQIIYPNANKVWQIKIKDDIYADLFEYINAGGKTYELNIQIPKELSITGMTINIKAFHYRKKDFKKAEEHAIKIVNNLI